MRATRALSVIPHTRTFEDEDELQGVMAEMASALHGSHATLVLHRSDRAPQLVYADPDSGLEAMLPPLFRSGALEWRLHQLDDPVWVRGTFGSFAPEVIALPLARVEGHSRLAVLIFFATLDDERKTATEEACLRYRPLVSGYFRLWQQERLLRRRIDATQAVLNRVKVAVMLISKSGEIAFANEAAHRLLHSDDGLCRQRGQLCARDRTDSITLSVSIAHVLEASERPDALEDVPLFTVRRTRQAPLVVSVLPVPHAVSEHGDTAALVIAVDPDLEIRDYASAVCRVFGLTRVETELACELASGVSLQETAARLRIKEETARGYLRTIFSKTGIHRQVDLVRMILMSLVRV